jgi:dephospho-CoA kinase
LEKLKEKKFDERKK